MQDFSHDNTVPDYRQCLELLTAMNVPARIIAHGEAVARTAVCLCGALLHKGLLINERLLCAAGLLHDIAKGMSGHAAQGARIVGEAGFGSLAGPIASHMDIFLGDDDALDEKHILYLADKLTDGTRTVTIEERMECILACSPKTGAGRAVIRTRMHNALKIKKRIEAATGRSLYDILRRCRERQPHGSPHAVSAPAW